MSRALWTVIALLLAACDTASPVTAPNNDAALAAAERQAVGDTDAALKDSGAPQSAGTKNVTDRSLR